VLSVRKSRRGHKYMKRQLIHMVLLVWCCAGSLTAQSGKWEAGLTGGTSFYGGDLAENNLTVLRETNAAVGLLVRYRPHTLLSTRATFTLGSLSGNDRNYTNNDYRQARGFTFTTTFQEYSLALEWDILGRRRARQQKDFGVWPYLFVGGAYTTYSQKTDFSKTILNQELGKLIVDDTEATMPDALVTVPFGIGTQIDINPQFHIGLELGYRPGVTDFLDGVSFSGNPDDNDWYGIFLTQFVYRFTPLDRDRDGIVDKDDQCPDIAGVPALMGCPDTDEDGIADHADACPLLPGPKTLEGCPDSDGDGVADRDDACPNDFGPLTEQGCPIVDTDGDGIVDTEDECPYEAGNIASRGCPVRDTDQDGILDNFDKCPDVFGLALFSGCPDSDSDGVEDAKDDCPNVFGDFENNGCPKTEASEAELTAIRSTVIFFEADSYTIGLDYYQSLAEVAAFLKRYPDYVLDVRGFADSKEGKTAGRRWLAKKRAQNIVDFLRSEGAPGEQLQVKGMGIDADSDRSDYRRRVDFEVIKSKVKP
jgi:OOP family OmpA-OmpF porin